MENAEIIKIFKEKNEKLKDKPIILVSAKTSDGIDQLKDKITEYSLNIVDKKLNESQNENSSLSLNSNSVTGMEEECCF